MAALLFKRLNDTYGRAAGDQALIIACAHAPLPELDPLLQQANAALYQAKANGRDRWVCFNANSPSFG